MLNYVPVALGFLAAVVIIYVWGIRCRDVLGGRRVHGRLRAAVPDAVAEVAVSDAPGLDDVLADVRDSLAILNHLALGLEATPESLVGVLARIERLSLDDLQHIAFIAVIERAFASPPKGRANDEASP